MIDELKMLLVKGAQRCAVNKMKQTYRKCSGIFIFFCLWLWFRAGTSCAICCTLFNLWLYVLFNKILKERKKEGWTIEDALKFSWIMEVVEGLGRGCYDMKLKIGVEYQSGNNFHHPLPKEL